MDNTTPHTWRFFKTCGLDQVAIRSGADIANLASLDQKLWAALSCPTRGIRFDQKTLDLLDSDHDGRIRAPELLNAVAWLSARLASFDALIDGSDTVKLAAFNTSTAEGKALAANAKRLLENLGKGSADAISLADVTDTAAIFAGTRFNGDGIIPADVAESPDTRQAIEEIIAQLGAETDRSGKPGVDQTKTDAFFDAVAALIAWADQPAADPAVLPLGAATAAAAEATAAVRAKIDDTFTRFRMAAFDSRAAQALSRTDADLAALADQELSVSLPALAAFPLTKIQAYDALPLSDGINPYWAADMRRFVTDAFNKLIEGGDGAVMTEAQWNTIKIKLAPYTAWQSSKPDTPVAALDTERLRALAAGSAREEITALIQQDAALADENARISDLEQLIRYHANLGDLLGNYVNMARLYDPSATAIFQIGTLYMDARACGLCFHVDDIAAHSALAAASKCCLAYCTLSRPGAKETRTVCAAFTSGFAQTLWVGRNGIFYDREGNDWDATITKLVDNPISVKEAFWDPWRKIATMISTQINKLLTSKQDAALASASQKVTTVGDTAAAPAAPAAEAPKKMEGAALASSVAAIGIAVGLLGSAIGGLVGLIAGLPVWKTALGILIVILLVSGPSMILAWFKLRARDIAPILNACGWAVNRRLRFSMKLGRLFTREATLPPGAVVELSDPYADRHPLRIALLIILALAVIALGAWYACVYLLVSAPH